MALFPLLAAAAPGLWQMGSGLIQGMDANKVKMQDTRPDSFKELTAMSRQNANSAIMPGQKSAEGRINQNFANSAAASMQAGTGSASVLANLSRLNQGANQASNQLADQAAGFQMQQKDKLGQVLRQDAAWQQQDLQNYQREKAALKQASATNLFGGLSSLASTALYAQGGGFVKDPITERSPYVNSINNPPVIQGYGGMQEQDYPMPGMHNNFRKLRPSFFGY